MGALKHTHMYIRVKKKGSPMYMCAHPDCTHRMNRSFLFGKRSVCNDCGKEFFLDDYALRRAKPKCPKCRGDGQTKIEPVEKFESKQDLAKKLAKLERLL